MNCKDRQTNFSHFSWMCRGDYRTGKRLNMRKVIAYVASQFRKDKIWLRRTQPSKRQYQIILAVDDSSSMVDNHSKQLAFESLACISNALTHLEAGELSIVRYVCLSHRLMDSLRVFNSNCIVGTVSVEWFITVHSTMFYFTLWEQL